MSTVRSIRIEKDIDEALRVEAKERRVSTNQLINSILRKYTEWDRFAEKLGYVGNSSFVYKLLVSLIPDDKLEQFGTDSAKLVKDALLVLYKRADLETFLRWMALVTKYAWGGSVRYDQKSEHDDYILTFHHTFGKRWSYGFSCQMREAIKDILGLDPNIVATENTLTVKIPNVVKPTVKQALTSSTPYNRSELISV